MTAPPDTVVSQILAQAPDPQVQAAMLLGSSFEGGWGPTFAEGDVGLGGSFGPFQILLAANPGVAAAQAEDPAYAVGYMLPRYEQAVQAQSPALWQTNPELAAEQAAYAAERPARDYLAAYGPVRVNTDWANVQTALTGADPAAKTATLTKSIGQRIGDAANAGAPGGAAAKLGQAVSSSVVADIKTAGAYVALVMAGLGLVVAGAYKTANPGISLRELPGKLTSQAKDAATLAAVA